MGLDAELGAVVAGGLTGVVAVAAAPVSVLRDELKRRTLDPLQLADPELRPDGRRGAGMPRGYVPRDNPLIPGPELGEVTTWPCRSTRRAAEWSRRRAMWRHSWKH